MGTMSSIKSKNEEKSKNNVEQTIEFWMKYDMKIHPDEKNVVVSIDDKCNTYQAMPKKDSSTAT